MHSKFKLTDRGEKIIIPKHRHEKSMSQAEVTEMRKQINADDNSLDECNQRRSDSRQYIAQVYGPFYDCMRL